ncbi:MAG: TRAP transporter small permease subunit [Arenicellales bacterium]|nr:TRAP transporter small permease subunit [Arenicellales bacterium]
MPSAIVKYVRFIDAMNRRLGRLVMYLIFPMMGVLLYATISRTFFDLPPIWTTEMAQMIMTAYYLLGGAYSMLLAAHVRMDLLYGSWAPKRRAFMDTITSCFLFFYVVILLYGGISSTQYAIEYNQKNFSVWAPPMAPIKVIMTIGILLMLLQVISTFFKELAAFRGKPIVEPSRDEGSI